MPVFINGVEDAVKSSLLTTIGDIIAASAVSTPARIAAPVSGQVLTGQGAGVLPAWAAGGGGALTSRARAYKSASAQSINAGSWTKITLDAESYDNLGEFANSRFTATIAGRYVIVATVYFLAMADGKIVESAIYVNGAIAARIRFSSGVAGTGYIPQVSDIMTLAVDDYVELYGFQDDTVARNVHNLTDTTYLAIHQLS